MANVAKSYIGLEQVGDIYTIDDKDYIKVKTKSGTLKQVRAYSNSEYKKLYPDLKIDHSNDPYWHPQKHALGFIEDYITIFKGDTYPHKEWFKSIGAVYRRYWGWGLASDLPLPTELPAGVEAVRLDWAPIAADDENIKPDEQVQAYVNSLVYEEDKSEYYDANIGDRIEITVTIEKAIPLNGYYGSSTMHIMRDSSNRCYVWTTGSKCWEAGLTKSIRGTIKGFNEYKGTKQTVLTRCVERDKK